MGNPKDLFRLHVCLYIDIHLFTTKKRVFFKQISHAGYSGRGRPMFSIEHSSNDCLRA